MNGINLGQYVDNGHGIGSSNDIQALMKAMEIGQLRGGDPNATSVGSLKVESLERTLKILAERQQDYRLWNAVPKLPAYSTVEEYERLESYGSPDQGGFIGEGELPEESDATYSRQAELVKYLGVTKVVTHQAQLVNSLVASMMQRAKEDGTMYILRKANVALHGGDANIVPHEFNGIHALQRKAFTTLDGWQNSNAVVDCRGSYLKEEYIEKAAQYCVDNNGMPDTLFGNTQVLSDFVKAFHGNKLIMPNTAAITDGVMGQRVRAFASQFGDIALGYDKFYRRGSVKLLGTAATHTSAPPKPVKDGSTPIAVVTDTATRFTDGAGDYFYAVSAVNKYGQSQLELINTSLQAVSATQAVNLKFAAGVGNPAATGFIIYRSKKDVTTGSAETEFYPIFKVSTAELAAGYDGGAAGLIRDRNRYIAGCEDAFVIENNDQVWAVKQLAPLMSMELARISPADRFMVLLYLTLQLYAPKKMIRILNIGPYVAS